LIEELKRIKSWLSAESWGTISYMESCDLYDDTKKTVERIEKLLSEPNSIVEKRIECDFCGAELSTVYKCDNCSQVY
jgi:hypothetical protein